MATKLNQYRTNKKGEYVPVKIARETTLTEVFGKHRGRNVIVELCAGDIINFRIKGTQQSFSMHLALAYTIAKVAEMDAQYRDAMDVYQTKKKAGLRTKKPKRPLYPVASKYINAIFR